MAIYDIVMEILILPVESWEYFTKNGCKGFESLNSFIIDDLQINMGYPAGFVQCCLNEATLSAAFTGFLFLENGI